MDKFIYIRNKVIKGFGRGSKDLACPTANVHDINHLQMTTGIYCGLAQLHIRSKDELQLEPGHEKEYKEMLGKLPFISDVKAMVCSFGYNPQYGNKEKSLEVYLMDNFGFDFYGAELRVLICKKLRDETKFKDLDELKQAIANDIKNGQREVAKFEKYKRDDRYFIVNNNHVITQNGKS